MSDYTLISKEDLIDVDALIEALGSGRYRQVAGAMQLTSDVVGADDGEVEVIVVGNCCLGVYGRQCLHVDELPDHDDEVFHAWSADFDHLDFNDLDADDEPPGDFIYLPDDHWLFTPIAVSHPQGKTWCDTFQDLLMRANDNFGQFEDYRMVIPLLKAFRDGKRRWEGTWQEPEQTRLVAVT